MSSLVALSVSIGVLGGVATALSLGPLSGIVLIWVAFIAWACYFAIGGDQKALQNTIVCGILGAVVAWVALLVILSIPLGETLTVPIWAGVVVAGSVLVMCLLAHVEYFSSIPASVLGYASVAAYALQTEGAFTMEALSSAGTSNALVVVAISVVVGAVFGMISGKVGGMLSSE
ncbi:MAG: DUF1097 domain-containing protein [Gammaproteobacteria bacterium]|nr:DUF1097 domain-containing protein [Gammaproteobacteria bacterium]MDE0153894.1 DUF1097 domain-containing protein [Gammaproteobacteria bacterium]MDE0301964.1 DUF1097 domain-containing protein [Gammaproteobacteria bacterium]MDE0612481.1 DUF1097 domain-containing protein [Gammaproteobacteria bacterium]